MDYVVRKNFHIGFVFDVDVDRCLAVDEKGNMINGDFLINNLCKGFKGIRSIKVRYFSSYSNE